ncbi:hypothetical protein KP509_38G005400 [Ceratopteris richardii]|uniref:Protein kinase domain-containing protein n=1 Tax=Ceratopteris richardii TaxID=49495 RepID=A0A8T2Q1K7_CERRI|nr:hypothetical protein KP509_38G005400 [Ceratopteris richardii]
MPLIANNHTPRSSWVGRTRFSRSICYGSNSSFLSSTAGLLLEDSNPEEFVKVVHEDHGLSLNSRESMTDGMIPSSRKTVPHNRTIGSSLSFGNSKPLLYASNCIDASSEKNRKRQYGQHRRSMSLPSKRVDANAVDDEKTNCSTGRSYATNTTSWSEYIVCSGNGFAVEEAENWMIDLSNLFLGNKFAFGAFSRLYIGKYKESPVAVKVLRKSDENEKISVRIDRQFKTEVNVLSKVEHRNVVKVKCLKAFITKHFSFSWELLDF